MEYLIGLVLALVGALFYQKTKRASAEALLENNEVKSKLNEKDRNIAKNQGLDQAEEQKRIELLKEANKEKGKNLNAKDMEDFFNNK